MMGGWVYAPTVSYDIPTPPAARRLPAEPRYRRGLSMEAPVRDPADRVPSRRTQTYASTRMFVRRRRLALVNTVIDEEAMATSASAGCMSPAGSPAAPSPRCKERPEQVLATCGMACDSRTALATPQRSPRTRVMSAASMAMSVPVPMAIPTFACEGGGR